MTGSIPAVRPAQQPNPPLESRRRGWLILLAVGVAIVGPFVGEWSEKSLPIALGSCGLAGLLAAAVSRGVRGAMIALALALIWVVVAFGLYLSGPPEPQGSFVIPLSVQFLIVFLIQAVCAEVGYLVGRLVAGLIRRPTSAAAAR